MAERKQPPPFVSLLETCPDLVLQEVLVLLGPKALASLAGVDRGCAAAVASTALMQWAKHVKMEDPPAETGTLTDIGAPSVPQSSINALTRLSFTTACSHAALGGNLEVLQQLLTTACPWEERTLCGLAALGGHLGVLHWLHNNGVHIDHLTIVCAARGGHLNVLEWLLEQCFPWLTGVECWLLREPWGPLTCASAAAGGHLNVLKWLRKRNFQWGWRTCAYAAKGGHLDVLRWLRENNCPWSLDTIYHATKTGQLEVVAWALANGCLDN